MASEPPGGPPSESSRPPGEPGGQTPSSQPPTGGEAGYPPPPPPTQGGYGQNPPGSQPGYGQPPAPTYQQGPPPGAYQPGAGFGGAPMGQQFAGFGSRFLAWLIDVVLVWVAFGIILGILTVVFGAVAGDGGRAIGLTIGYLVSIIGSIAYFIYCWTARNGQTIGNQVLHIRVVKTDGSRLTGGSAVLRYLGFIVNSIICGLPIGYIWAAFDAQKQGWHDKIASTYVVRA